MSDLCIAVRASDRARPSGSGGFRFDPPAAGFVDRDIGRPLASLRIRALADDPDDFAAAGADGAGQGFGVEIGDVGLSAQRKKIKVQRRKERDRPKQRT